jgi:hypothetical protein
MKDELNQHVRNSLIVKSFVAGRKILPFRTVGVLRLFPGEGKNFPGGQEPTVFLPKDNKNDIIFLKKFLKHTIFGRLGGQEPPLPPTDAHVSNL